MVLRKELRLSFCFANQPFCQSDISMVQLNSNWRVGEGLLASDQVAVWECWLFLFKGQQTFLGCLVWKFIRFVLSCHTWYSGNCSDCHLALQTDHFVNRTFRESNWHDVSLGTDHPPYSLESHKPRIPDLGASTAIMLSRRHLL